MAEEIVLVADPWPPFNIEPGGDKEGPASIETVSIGVAAGYDYRRWLNDYISSHLEANRFSSNVVDREKAVLGQ